MRLLLTSFGTELETRDIKLRGESIALSGVFRVYI